MVKEKKDLGGKKERKKYQGNGFLGRIIIIIIIITQRERERERERLCLCCGNGKQERKRFWRLSPLGLRFPRP